MSLSPKLSTQKAFRRRLASDFHPHAHDAICTRSSRAELAQRRCTRRSWPDCTFKRLGRRFTHCERTNVAREVWPTGRSWVHRPVILLALGVCALPARAEHYIRRRHLRHAFRYDRTYSRLQPHHSPLIHLLSIGDLPSWRTIWPHRHSRRLAPSKR